MANGRFAGKFWFYYIPRQVSIKTASSMIKKLIIGIIVLLASLITGFGICSIGSPEIVFVNDSSQSISEVIVKLPSNRVVFGAVSPKSESTIYYSWTQADGVYEYQVLLPGGLNQSGRCGYVTQQEIGKRLTLIVHTDLTVTCEESSKI